MGESFISDLGHRAIQSLTDGSIDTTFLQLLDEANHLRCHKVARDREIHRLQLPNFDFLQPLRRLLEGASLKSILIAASGEKNAFRKIIRFRISSSQVGVKL